MSNCNFTIKERDGSRFVFECTACGRKVFSTRDKAPRAACKVEAPAMTLAEQNARRLRAERRSRGVGTELKKLLAELGIRPKSNCGCDGLAAQMNEWGIEGCKANREQILSHLQAAYDEAAITEKLKAATLAIVKGLPKSIPGLFELACEQAGKEELGMLVDELIEQHLIQLVVFVQKNLNPLADVVTARLRDAWHDKYGGGPCEFAEQVIRERAERFATEYASQPRHRPPSAFIDPAKGQTSFSLKEGERVALLPTE